MVEPGEVFTISMTLTPVEGIECDQVDTKVTFNATAGKFINAGAAKEEVALESCSATAAFQAPMEGRIGVSVVVGNESAATMVTVASPTPPVAPRPVPVVTLDVGNGSLRADGVATLEVIVGGTLDDMPIPAGTSIVVGTTAGTFVTAVGGVSTTTLSADQNGRAVARLVATSTGSAQIGAEMMGAVDFATVTLSLE
ncbi:MAG: hypothetical protein RMA76_00875 [Deltaproteobacteria bacterium]